jgi:hypothetical protein
MTIATFPERSRPRSAIRHQRPCLGKCLVPSELKNRETLGLASDPFAVPWSAAKGVLAAFFKATPAAGGARFGLPRSEVQGGQMGKVALLAGRT